MTYIKTATLHHQSRTPVIARLCLLATLAFVATTGAQTMPQKLPAISLGVGIYLINAEVAQTPDQRAIGLMNRPTMGVSDGMLFAFEAGATQCFWMKNTLLPLSIAFIDDDGAIVNIIEMKPQSLESHCSTKPVRFALEMNQGWFAKRGIKAGSKLTGQPWPK